MAPSSASDRKRTWHEAFQATSATDNETIFFDSFDSFPLLFESLVAKVRELNYDHYAEVLDKHEDSKLGAILFNETSPKLEELVSQKACTLSELLNLGGDLKYEGPAIYLHILVDRTNPGRYYLYIGQAKNLRQRIAEHKSPSRRKSSPSLHYYVMDQPNMEGTFVVLMRLDPKAPDLQYRLNISEMGNALLFQTLPSQTLRRYIPEEAVIRRPGGHLNIASCLAQGMSDDGASASLLWHSKEPLILAYAEEQLKKARKANCSNRRDKSIREAMEGKDVVPRIHKGSGSTDFRDMAVCIPARSLETIQHKDGEKINIICDLKAAGKHNNMFCLKAEAGDPAERLAIKVTCHGISDFITTNGKQAVFKINTLVDEMEGISEDITEKTARRFLRTNKDRGRLKSAYT